MKKTNPKKLNRYSVILVVALLLAMLSTTVVGCGKPSTTDDSPSTSEVVSETPSTSEVSEPVLEEPSEEIISEEPSEEIMDLTPYTNANGKKTVDLIADMDYDEFKIVVWRNGVGAKTILSDGDSYELQDEDDLLALYFPNTMVDIQSNEHVDIYGGNESSSGFNVMGYGENLQVIFTGTDVDGKEYEITVNITKDWKYSWEE